MGHSTHGAVVRSAPLAAPSPPFLMATIPTDYQIREEARLSKDIRERLLLMILERLEAVCNILVHHVKWRDEWYHTKYDYIEEEPDV